MTRPNCWQPTRIEIIALKRSAAENPEGDSNTTPANILWILHFGQNDSHFRNQQLYANHTAKFLDGIRALLQTGLLFWRQLDLDDLFQSASA